MSGSVTVETNISGTTTSYVDNGMGEILDSTQKTIATIDYSTGEITPTADGATPLTLADGDTMRATYQYDNETVGPNAQGDYGAQMGKGYLQLDEFNLIAEAHQLACYWSIYSAFAAQTEYGSNIADIAKEAAFSEQCQQLQSIHQSQ